MAAYGDPRPAHGWRINSKKSGKRLNMGKSCVRFKTADDLPLDAIAAVIAKVTPEKVHQECTRRRGNPPPGSTDRGRIRFAAA